MGDDQLRWRRFMGYHYYENYRGGYGYVQRANDGKWMAVAGDMVLHPVGKLKDAKEAVSREVRRRKRRKS
jgi:hypothetical protein